MKEFAILGPTASGKSALSIELANKLNGIILSLDSLSIYKKIDIASAKPSKEEMGNILHFGIDELYPNEDFNITKFFELYKTAKNYAFCHEKTLIIVGGTSFYLKALLSGLSEKPQISDEIKNKIQTMLQDLSNVFDLMQKIDPIYAKKISPNDSYRIEKWLEIYLSTNEIPSVFNAKNPPKPIIENLDIFEIDTPKDELLQKIILRTDLMIKNGLINEVFELEKAYSRSPNSLKAIGIKEVLDYLDGVCDFKTLKEKIITNTARLAKRQKTFNKTQFLAYNLKRASVGELRQYFNSLSHRQFDLQPHPNPQV